MLSSKRRANSFTISQATELKQGIKFAAIFCALTLLFASVFALTFSPAAISLTAEADGRAESVVELSTGRALYSRNADQKLPMASTTKIMTALLIIEDCNLDEVITVPDEAVGVEGSSIYLKRGEVISVKDLLYGLMLRSGNDSATALAIHHSGSTSKFVDAMNARAAEMGAESTHFTNPSGLPDESHYTTAKELSLIACEAMKNDTFKTIVSTRNYTGEYRSYVNKNKMLSRVEGANGIKTGYTLKAGRCLVSSAEREGMDIICVVLNCPNMYERSEKLIENAFAQFELAKIDKNTVFMCGIVPCNIAKDAKVLIKKGEEITIKTYLTNSDGTIKQGDKVGKLEIYCQNDLIFSGDLYSIVNR